MDQRGRWTGHGHLLNAQTAKAPVIAGTLVVHRGNQDNGIWYKNYVAGIPANSTETRIPDAETENAPAIATCEISKRKSSKSSVVVYRRPDNALVYTQYITQGHYGSGWSKPKVIPGAWSLHRPTLAMHGDLLYAAFKSSTSEQIWIAIYNGRSWILHRTIPGHYTSEGPALVSYRNKLYVLYKGHNSDRFWYGEVPDTTPQILTVMTLNVCMLRKKSPNRWSDRLPRIIKMLKIYENGKGPHILGIQEVTPGMYNDLRNRMPEPHHRSIFERRGGPATQEPDEGIAFFYRPDRVELLEWGEFVMTQDDRKRWGNCRPSSGGHPENRHIIWGRFRDKLANRAFYVYNTHFGGSSCQTTGCAHIMARHIRDRAYSTKPVIAMGDFNVGMEKNGQHHGSYQTLLNHTRLVNSYCSIHDKKGKFATHNDDFANIRTGRMIDYILISPSFQVYDADIDRTMFTRNGDPIPCYRIDPQGRCSKLHRASDLLMYSDHWAVWTNLVWSPE